MKRRAFITLLGGADQVHVVGRPALVELNVDARRPAFLSQLFPERAHPRLHFHICGSIGHQDSDAAHAFWLLPTRRERPRCSAAQLRGRSRGKRSSEQCQ